MKKVLFSILFLSFVAGCTQHGQSDSNALNGGSASKKEAEDKVFGGLDSSRIKKD